MFYILLQFHEFQLLLLSFSCAFFRMVFFPSLSQNNQSPVMETIGVTQFGESWKARLNIRNPRLAPNRSTLFLIQM
jgi:hypothetical protein